MLKVPVPSVKVIPQMEPSFDEKEAQAVYEYMQSGGWVTEFRKTREFEQRIAEYTGAAYCSVVNNGTAALFLALKAVGVGPGDEVIVPDYTMVATANAVKLAGAEVVFVDISLHNLCMNFALMQQAITPRTKAVILVSINGRAPDVSRFVRSCHARGVSLIEDAAQSLGSWKGEYHLGSIGDMGIFSFSAPKIITTGQGGAVVTLERELIERIRKLRDFGRDGGGSDHYLTMGWNFKFTDIQAVIGLEQMKKLPSRVHRKKIMYTQYRRSLEGMAGLEFIPTDMNNTAPWFVDILVADGRRDELAAHLNERMIGTRPFYPALHAEPVYARPGSYPVAERVAREGLWLPSSLKLTEDDIEHICLTIRFWGRGNGR